MGLGQQTFQTMTSYLQGVENSDGVTEARSSSRAHTSTYTPDTSHPSGRVGVQPQDTYSGTFTQETYPHPSTSAQPMGQSHESQSSQQRIHNHDDHPDASMEYEYSSYTRSHLSYQSRASHHSIDHYPGSLEQVSTRPKVETHLTIESLASDDHRHHQSRPDVSLVNYHETLKEYHTAQSTILEQQQRQHDGSRDDRDRNHSRNRHEPSSAYVDNTKNTGGRAGPYQQDISLLPSPSSIPMSNYPPSPITTGHGLPRFEFKSHQNEGGNLRHSDLEDGRRLPNNNSRHHHHHYQRHHDQAQVDVGVTNLMPALSSFEPTAGERHPRSRPTADALSHNYRFIRNTSPSSSSYYQQQHHQNISAHAHSRHQHHGHTTPLPYEDHIDPHSMANENGQLGDAYDHNIDLDSNSQSSSIGLSLASQPDGLVGRSRSDDLALRSSANSYAMIVSRAEVDSDPGQEQLPVKKKKKSKMHECEVCQKKFPRPSGLKTHMNTHNNERPYACGFPGCDRTFGVRSNAKRHLRTHGILATPAAPPGQAQYIVGFDTPVVLPDHHPNGHDYGQGAGSRDAKGLDDAENPDETAADDDDEDQRHHEDRHESIAGRSRMPMYKVRWMPPSLMTRASMEESFDGIDHDEQRAIEHHIHDQDRMFDDPYRLNLRHDYEHEPGHGDNSHRHEHEHDRSRLHYPNSRHDQKGKQRWRGDSVHPSSMGLEYPHDLDRPPPFDPDNPSSSANTLSPGFRPHSGSTSRYSTTGSRVSSIPSAQAGQPVYAEPSTGRRFSESSSSHSVGLYDARRPSSSTTSSSLSPYSDASRKTKEQGISKADDAHPYLQARSHPYDSAHSERPEKR